MRLKWDQFCNLLAIRKSVIVTPEFAVCRFQS